MSQICFNNNSETSLYIEFDQTNFTAASFSPSGKLRVRFYTKPKDSLSSKNFLSDVLVRITVVLKLFRSETWYLTETHVAQRKSKVEYGVQKRIQNKQIRMKNIDNNWIKLMKKTDQGKKLIINLLPLVIDKYHSHLHLYLF